MFNVQYFNNPIHNIYDGISNKLQTLNKPVSDISDLLDNTKQKLEKSASDISYCIENVLKYAPNYLKNLVSKTSEISDSDGNNKMQYLKDLASDILFQAKETLRWSVFLPDSKHNGLVRNDRPIIKYNYSPYTSIVLTWIVGLRVGYYLGYPSDITIGYTAVFFALQIGGNIAVRGRGLQ